MYVLKTTISKLNFAGNKVRQLLLSRKLKKIPIMQSDTDSNKTVWDPINVLNPPTHYKYAVIILNRPLLWKRDILFNIWEKAQINATVNGGTLRWIHYLEKQGIDLLNKKYSEYVPDLITGDMDSCSPAVLEQMKSMGSMVVETPDQNLTDYTKALIEIGQLNKKANLKLKAIYVFVETSGRCDHILANINTLYKSDQYIKDVQIIQIANNSLTWLLKRGFHTINIPNTLVQNSSSCGLFPIGEPTNSITTTGLKWNLNNATMRFGGLVSSSNTYTSSKITIHTDSPVIWTMSIAPLKENVNSCGKLTVNSDCH
ncbi:thiamine pyrophosphokinase 1-like isoform X1 [Colletes latitarsis]|uniref:thiamine pyrophosphokinase 1-like isoform X1 n=2 Tax=Colletes latitarsis TaxID=2605962 RepID=UPI004035AFA4